MKLLLDANGAVTIRNGAPVYVRDTGQEIEFDGAKAFEKIGHLTGENTAYKKRFEEAEARAKAYEGIEDPDAARKALETVKSLSAGELKTVAQVAEITAAAQKAAQEQVAAASKAHVEKLALTQAELAQRTQELNTHIIGGGFSRTKLITDDKHPTRLAIPADVAEAFFGRYFKVENGKAVGYDSAGNKIYSTTKPGEVADFDEALEHHVRAYPQRDAILKGSGASGSGATGGGGSGAGGSKTVPRAQFDSMSQMDRAKFAKEGGKVTD